MEWFPNSLRKNVSEFKLLQEQKLFEEFGRNPSDENLFNSMFLLNEISDKDMTVRFGFLCIVKNGDVYENIDFAQMYFSKKQYLRDVAKKVIKEQLDYLNKFEL